MGFGQVFMNPLAPAPGPEGVALNPVIQPIGNQDAYTFLAATAWPQLHRDGGTWVSNGSRWPAGRPRSCMPVRPDFYSRYSGAQPEGPLTPQANPWPGTAKPWPGGLMMHDGRGGYLVSAAQLPANGRAPATTEAAMVTDPALLGEDVTRGAGLMWLIAAGIGVWLATRGRRI